MRSTTALMNRDHPPRVKVRVHPRACEVDDRLLRRARGVVDTSTENVHNKNTSSNKIQQLRGNNN